MVDQKIEEAKKFMKIADHMVYITFPAMKENRLLIKILEQINKAQKSLIAFILDNEYKNKRIRLYADPVANFKTFIELGPRYGLNAKHIETIKHTSALIEMHSNSPMEFVKNDKFIIMSETMQMESLTYEKVKNYLIQSKEMLKNAEKC